ncbi:ATP-dependent Clp protease ATP-binding subunit ClpX [Kwoniella heveanensis BCC8398]|uniref:ATP-dependent Clp protease ATP-binding subunit ClpX n=1 Tax=Kwoniella heveanensis BCC8398 TaxID=1296120 RepID=A0A1B9GI92_9TREE|nr:ATP-dependent Clp protease ATP-binding subunit ClpX [Kwoniella heveanensis BCC8398]
MITVRYTTRSSGTTLRIRACHHNSSKLEYGGYRFASSSSTTRPTTSASSTSDVRDEEAPFTGWSVRSPKDLYNHLSQYIVGQERAKRILSVAVFNHYHRIAPRLPPQEPPPPPAPSPPPRQQPPPIILDPPIAAPPSPSRHSGSWDRLPSSSAGFRRDNVPPATTASVGTGAGDVDTLMWDPSRGGSQLDDGRRQRDATKVTGAGADGADPTLTHDMLTFRSREGQWARNGYFSAKPPPTTSQPSLLGQAIKQRKSASQSTVDPQQLAYPNANLTTNSGQNPSRNRRKRVEIESDNKPPILEAEPPITQKEEVVIEKSNVLMIGPTGTGKTLMARTLANILDVPFASCDATSYTQAGYVGEDVENCVLRLLQNAEYDVNRAEVGIIHIDEIDKLARRGGGDAGSWSGGRDVGGEGVQQALLRLLEGTSLTLSAKPPPITSTNAPSGSSSFTPSSGSSPGSSSSGPKAESVSAFGDPPGWDPNNPMNRNVGGKKSVREGLPGFSSGGGSPGGKSETFVVDTTNILFVLSGAFVGLESIVNRRLGKGSIGFGAPLPKPPPTTSSSSNPLPLTGLSTQDLSSYGLIPEFLGRLPVLSVLHPLSIDDLIRILVEPRNALIKQYMAIFERYGSSLKFTKKAVREIAKEGLERGGGARGLRGVLEETLVDAMFEVPGSSVRYCLITEAVVKKQEPALYYSRGQRMQYLQAIEDEDGKMGMSTSQGQNQTQDIENEDLDPDSEQQRISATG